MRNGWQIVIKLWALPLTAKQRNCYEYGTNRFFCDKSKNYWRLTRKSRCLNRLFHPEKRLNSLKSAIAQEVNCLFYGRPVPHDKGVGGMDDQMVSHTGEFSVFDRDLAIVRTGNQPAVDPVNGSVAGDDADWKISRA